MPTFSRQLLSASTDGLPVVVAATASPGTLLHTAVGGAGRDEVFIWVANVTGGPATLSVQWGSTSDPAGMACKGLSIPPNGPPVPIMVGQTIANAQEVRAFSDTASALNITGYINRIQ